MSGKGRPIDPVRFSPFTGLTCEAVGANCGNGSVEAAEGEQCDGAAGSFPANAMCGGDCRFDCVYGYELQEGACTEIVIITPF